MRVLQRNAVARLLTAAVVAALLTAFAHRVGVVAVVVALFGALLVIAFAALTIAPDAIAFRRRHYWRWGGRTGDDDGPKWPGTRIPRTPRSPRR